MVGASPMTGDDGAVADERRADGDGSIDDQLFTELYPRLRRFAAVVAPLDLDPDDLLQEAVARALRGGPLARLDHPLAYLRRTMVNLASNHNRSRGRERRAHLRLAPDGLDAVGETYPSDLAELERVGPEDRAVLFLADVERLPLDEVAAALGIRPAAARARASRARSRLRSALTEQGDHP